jgi:hypothetical protein
VSSRSAGCWRSPRPGRGRRLASPEQSRRRFREQLHRNVGFIRRGASSCTLPICCGRAPVLTGFEAALIPYPGTVMRDAGCGLQGTTLPRTPVNRIGPLNARAVGAGGGAVASGLGTVA